MLYKYTNSYLEVLKNRQVKISKPSELNDPYEFKCIYEERLSDNELMKLICDPVSIQKWESHYDLISSGNNRKERRSAQIKKKDIPKLLLASTKEATKNMCKNVVSNIEEDYGIFCASKTPTNIVLWSHYAQEHTGAVIAFSFKDKILNNSIREVVYNNEICRLSTDALYDNKTKYESFLNIITTKYTDWKYEEEVRFLYPLNSCKKLNTKNSEIYLMDVNEDEISEVYLGSRMKKNDKESLIKMINSEYSKSDISIYDCSLSEDVYKINTKKIT